MRQHTYVPDTYELISEFSFISNMVHDFCQIRVWFWFVCFFSEGILPFKGVRSLFCDRGLDCDDELIFQHEQQASVL